MASLSFSKRIVAAGLLTAVILSLGIASPYDAGVTSHIVAIPTAQAAPKPACLSAAEKMAVEDRAAGRSYDREAYKRAKKKLDQAEKFRGQRNRQKRCSG